MDFRNGFLKLYFIIINYHLNMRNTDRAIYTYLLHWAGSNCRI